MKLFSPFTVIFIIFFTLTSKSQEENKTIQPVWRLKYYGESFITIKSDADKNSKISEFQYNHNRLNNLNINHSFVGIQHESQNVRINTALHFGSYVKDNYKNEPGFIKNIYEANAGFLICKKNNIWMDAGVFPSFIGFEGVNAFDNITVTRSLLAENSPYFLNGLRINYPKNNNTFNFYVLTGWQRILPLQNNSLPSFGAQWTKEINETNILNWSFFVGSEYPDTDRKWRYFNNFYWKSSFGKWSQVLGLDIGAEQKQKKGTDLNHWWSPVLISSYEINKHFKAAVRIEHYSDKNAVIIRTSNGEKMIGSGASLNLDYHPNASILCRAEWRNLWSANHVFIKKNEYTKQTSYLSFSIAYKLDRNL